ncbi:hypothetical protein LDL59_04095 [Kaistella anthropi]|nr:hypothetical protein [Kaistella anthropi]
MMTSTRQIVSEFMQSGYEILEKYSRGSLYNDHRTPKTTALMTSVANLPPNISETTAM